MSRFKFRLEKILRLRAQEETARAVELGNAVANAEVLRQVAEEARDYLEHCRQQLTHSGDGVQTAGALRNLNLAVESAARQVSEAQEEHRASQDEVESRREVFSEARRDRRVIERLRERQVETWSMDASRDEQKESDGVARQSWNSRGES